MTFDVVIPTCGRPSLNTTLPALADGPGPAPGRIFVVDDRGSATSALRVDVPTPLRGRVVVMRGLGRGPAAARNLGWKAGDSEWVAFLDDDVVPQRGWRQALAADLDEAGAAAATQGNIRVPLSDMRPATDSENNVLGLEHASWATADIAYRRDMLSRIGGFDERFPRAYREDADIGLRTVEAGGWIVRGRRWVEHPAPPQPWTASMTRQRGNADDALMLLLHGPGWERRAGAPRGARRRHLATTALLMLALAGISRGSRTQALTALAGWGAMTARFAWQRARRGPRTPSELATVTATSLAIPLAASAWWAAGLAAGWRLTRTPSAVLVDRDGTLVEDVPYTGDPGQVRLRPGVRAGLERLRRAGIPIAVVSNQSGLARGLVARDQVDAVNRRVEELAGPFEAWFVCPHGPEEGCGCRKPQPGLLVDAARHLGVKAGRCAVIGDIEADMTAAQAAGARGILVPTPATRPDEVRRAREVARTFDLAVARLLGPA